MGEPGRGHSPRCFTRKIFNVIRGRERVCFAGAVRVENRLKDGSSEEKEQPEVISAKKRLGEILVEAGLISEAQLGTALSSQKTWGGKLGSTLIRMGFVREEDLLRCLSAQLRLPSVDFSKIKIAPKTLQLIPVRIAEKYGVIPVALKEEMGKKTVILAMSDPSNLDSINEIQFQTGINIRPIVASETAISRAIDEYYGQTKAKTQYGFEKRVDLSLVESADEMVILSRGEERAVSPLDGLDAAETVHLLIRVLLEKGIVTKADFERAMRRPR